MSAFATAKTEYGFLFGESSQVVRVPEGFADVAVAGLPVERLWFYRATVSGDRGVKAEHLVVNAHYPKLAKAIREQLGALLAQAFAGTNVAFVLEESEGRAVVEAGGLVQQAAFAVAVLKRQCSWDESECFEIVVGDESYHVTCVYRGGEHVGSVSSSGRPTSA